MQREFLLGKHQDNASLRSPKCILFTYSEALRSVRSFVTMRQEPIILYSLPFASISQVSAHVNYFLHLQAISNRGLPIFLLLLVLKDFLKFYW
jgi:hypothetical protein